MLQIISENAVFMTDYTAFGGVEKVTLNLIKLLEKQSLKISNIISLYKQHDTPFVNYGKYVKINTISTPNASFKQYKQDIKLFFSRRRYRNLIVQIQDIDIALEVCRAAQNSGSNVISVLHNSPLLYMKLYTPGNNIIKQLLRASRVHLYRYWRNKVIFRKIVVHSNKFVCISQKAAHEFITKVKPKEQHKIVMIYNPVKLKYGDALTTGPVILKEDILIYAGRLDPLKQVDKVVEVWSNIEPLYPNWKFIILGSGAEYQKISDLINTRGLKNVVLKEPVPNIEDYLSKSKVCVLFSLTEGLPTILLEASLFHNALIGNDGFGGTADIIQDRVNGFLVSESNMTVLEQQLIKLFSNPKMIEDMGKKSFENLKKFDSSLTLSAWNNILK